MVNLLKEKGAGKSEHKGRNQDRLLTEAVEEHTGRDRHDAVGDKEAEGEEAGQGETQTEPLDDVRYQRSEDVGEERDDKEDEKDEKDDAHTPLHAFTSLARWR